MAFGQFRAVRSMDQRNMRPFRHGPAKSLVNLALPGGIGEMVVAADHMRNGHVMVVHNHGQHIGWRAIGAQQHEIVEILVGPCDLALHLIADAGFTLLRRAQAKHRLDSGGRVAGLAIPPAAIVARRTALGTGFFAHVVEFLLAGIAGIGAALRHKPFDSFAVPSGAGKLIDDVAVMIEAQPGQSVENGRNCALCRALAVGILDSQKHPATKALGIQPVEQGRARPANMQIAGRGWRKARDDGCRHDENPKIMGKNGAQAEQALSLAPASCSMCADDVKAGGSVAKPPVFRLRQGICGRAGDGGARSSGRGGWGPGRPRRKLAAGVLGHAARPVDNGIRD